MNFGDFFFVLFLLRFTLHSLNLNEFIYSRRFINPLRVWRCRRPRCLYALLLWLSLLFVLCVFFFMSVAPSQFSAPIRRSSCCEQLQWTHTDTRTRKFIYIYISHICNTKKIKLKLSFVRALIYDILFLLVMPKSRVDVELIVCGACCTVMICGAVLDLSVCLFFLLLSSLFFSVFTFSMRIVECGTW